MPTAMSSLRRASTAPLTAALLVIATALSAQAQEHTLYVAVADSDGNPVTGLTRGDLVVQWDGRNLETTGFGPAGRPVRLTVLVDNGDAASDVVPQMRDGLRALLRELPAEIDVAILSLAGGPRRITRHTSDRAELERGVLRILPNPGAGPRFTEALAEETDRIHADDDRGYYPVVVVVGADGTDASRSSERRVDRMMERMVNNSVEVHTLLFDSVAIGREAHAGGVRRHMGRLIEDGDDGRGGAGFASSYGLGAGFRPSAIGQALAPTTRGSFERIIAAPAFVDKLTELGRDIARKHRMVSNQYRITYRQPRNPSSQPRIAVAARGEGRLQMTATLDGNVPARMPQP